MRILFLDQFSELGGAQQALLDTVDAVQQNGWDPNVLVPGRGPLVEALQSRHVQIGDIPCGPYNSGHKSAADSVRFARDLRRQVRIVRDWIGGASIGLIYVNGPRLLPAAALAARGEVPVVLHLHSHLHGSALRLTRWVLGWTAPTAIACSNSVVKPLGRHIDKRKLHVIPNGVRDAGYHERDFGRGGCLRIGMIGRIAREKGQLAFVNAVALLKHEFPQAHFVICGAPLFQASRDYFDAVRLRARDLPVEFVGWQEDVNAVLSELDLLVVPSLKEGMGRIVLEAFSAGVPVVAFPAGGIPEAVVDGVTGFLTREFSDCALAARIREAMTSEPETLRQIARNARQAWAQSYTLSAFQKHITNLLETRARASREERVTEMPLQRR
ncbi:MAG: glycosyltransferase family 4 protein [Bryobacteraceae bacterium]